MLPAVHIHLSKAFDPGWIKGLLFILHTYGITGNLFKWFNSNLVNRKQGVMYREVLLSTWSINAGVSQGSVLGPFLFLKGYCR